MRNLLISAATFAALVTFTPAPSFAQVSIEGPGVGVRVGEPRYRDHWRDDYRWRDREVRGGRGCREITIRREGMVKRIRKCDY